MDDLWKRTFDALSQLQREIREGNPKTGTQHMDTAHRYCLIGSIEAVMANTASVARLGAILIGKPIHEGAYRWQYKRGAEKIKEWYLEGHEGVTAEVLGDFDNGWYVEIVDAEGQRRALTREDF